MNLLKLRKKYSISNILINFFLIISLNFIFINSSQASKNGMGDLKISEEMMNYIVDLYFNTENKNDKPGGLAITKDGDMIGWAVCPARYAGDCIMRDLEPLKYCRENVKKYLGLKENCWMLARKRKIVWNNMNIEVPKGISNNEVREIFKRLGLYGDSDESSNKTTNENQSDNITAELKKLKKLLDDGVISKEEFDKAKKKILN